MKTNEEFLTLVNEKVKNEKESLSKKKRLAKHAAATTLSFVIIFTAVLTALKFENSDSIAIDGIAFDGIKVEALDVSQNLTENLSSDFPPKAAINDLDEEITSATDFAFDLFRAAYEGDNILISPYSVYTALAMTANGADGKTRDEIENVLGMTTAEINDFLYKLRMLQNKSGSDVLKTANSVWFKNNMPDFSVSKDYLLTLKDYYDAEAFAAPFNDTTVNDINSWISDNTDGMIDEVLDTIPENAVMYNINTVLFEDEWNEKYGNDDVSYRAFYSKNGKVIKTSFLHRSDTALLTFENAYGMIDKYKNGGCFIAILPNEGVSIQEFIDTLTAESFNEAKTNKNSDYSVATTFLPQIKSETDLDLVNTLKAMGIKQAFTLGADFSNTSNVDMHISRIIHKTKLELDKTGTKASAATVVEWSRESRRIGTDDELLQLIFDRPFLYMILDSQGFPIFIGTLENLGE